jgi:hypothetical protein
MKCNVTPNIDNGDSIIINGVEYIRYSSVPKPVEHSTGDLKIIVLQHQWVYIGRLDRDANDCRLHNAYNIRVWGTKTGLGELVNGPTCDTILDKCDGLIEFDWRMVVHTITVDASQWKL